MRTPGIWAPVLLVSLRLLQGLALGGEYGGAAIYVAEHAPPGKRGFFTSFIQMSVVGGFLLSLCVVLLTTAAVGQEAFEAWGWRIPFLASLLLLGVSLYIRLKLRESPVFAAMKAAGTTAKAPLREAFALPGNARTMLVAMIGVAAGLTVIWYTAQFQTLYFLQRTALIDDATAALMVGGAMVAIAPLFVVFGWLSDKVGRKPVMLGGYGCSLLLLFPAFHLLAGAANPMLAAATARAPVTIAGPGCQFNPFAGRQATPCGEALQFLAGRGIGHSGAIGRGETLTVRVGDTVLTGFDKPRIRGGADRCRLSVEAVHRAAQHDPDHAGDRAARRAVGVDLRPGRGDHGRAVSGAHPLHVDVAAVPHRHRLFRRLPAADRAVRRRQDRQSVRRAVVHLGRGRGGVRGDAAVAARDARPRYPGVADTRAGEISLAARPPRHRMSAVLNSLLPPPRAGC